MVKVFINDNILQDMILLAFQFLLTLDISESNKQLITQVVLDSQK